MLRLEQNIKKWAIYRERDNTAARDNYWVLYNIGGGVYWVPDDLLCVGGPTGVPRGTQSDQGHPKVPKSTNPTTSKPTQQFFTEPKRTGPVFRLVELNLSGYEMKFGTIGC